LNRVKARRSPWAVAELAAGQTWLAPRVACLPFAQKHRHRSRSDRTRPGATSRSERRWAESHRQRCFGDRHRPTRTALPIVCGVGCGISGPGADQRDEAGKGSFFFRTFVFQRQIAVLLEGNRSAGACGEGQWKISAHGRGHFRQRGREICRRGICEQNQPSLTSKKPMMHGRAHAPPAARRAGLRTDLRSVVRPSDTRCSRE
jgi:hypothetical protein